MGKLNRFERVGYLVLAGAYFGLTWYLLYTALLYSPMKLAAAVWFSVFIMASIAISGESLLTATQRGDVYAQKQE